MYGTGDGPHDSTLTGEVTTDTKVSLSSTPIPELVPDETPSLPKGPYTSTGPNRPSSPVENPLLLPTKGFWVLLPPSGSGPVIHSRKMKTDKLRTCETERKGTGGARRSDSLHPRRLPVSTWAPVGRAPSSGGNGHSGLVVVEVRKLSSDSDFW